MTPQPDALPACVHGHNAYIYNHGDYWTVATTPVKPCSCIVRGAPNRDMAIAAWTALCAPHALAASRAEVERLRKALKRAVERIRCAACKPGVGICSNHVDEFDMKHTYLPALAAQGGGT